MKNHKEFALTLANEAGKIIKDAFHRNMKIAWKQDQSPLTKSDLAINKFVVEALRRETPDYSIIAEEGSSMLPGAEFSWVCDPLDGTVGFAHGVPTCAFALALTRRGQSVLGIIYDPFMDRMFSAEQGKGASLNNEAIQVSAAKNLERIVVGLPIWKGDVYETGDLFQRLVDKWAFPLNNYSTHYMTALVASGEFGASLYFGNKAHDSAAGKIIVEEAGGRMTDLFGSDQKYDQPVSGYLATNGHLHDEVLSLLKETVSSETVPPVS